MAVIDVRHLRKRYGGREVVRDVTFTVEPGEIFGIIGPNGAGKTTTVECVEGLRTADGGAVRVLGREPGDPELRQRLGVQLQESQLPDRIRVREAMELFASFYDRPAATGPLLERLGLGEHREQQYKKLSGGQKQRLSIALSLVGSPEVAVLDELTTGLDPQARRDTLAADRGHPRGRRHRPAGDPLHGRGRAAVRPDSGDRRRPDGGRRQSRRAHPAGGRRGHRHVPPVRPARGS
ncbi:ABC transporter ATP-binding protein [Dactylosporangium sp. CS-047395]|uniref:ABC transporter ATP-binding protein n=1 Tax=Dactylosporangium sp. CS-047395 TaxID=3239936 RepID=UPI003D93CC1E